MNNLLEELMTDKSEKSDCAIAFRVTQKVMDKLGKVSEKTGKTKSGLAKAIFEAGLKQIEL